MFQKTVIDRYLSQQDKELVAARYEANQKLFGEDRGLLPANSSLGILHDWKTLQKMGYGQPLYEFFKNFFRRIDSGYVNEDDHTKDVFAYNGGPHGRGHQRTRLPHHGACRDRELPSVSFMLPVLYPVTSRVT